jgi:hypothetical protein
MISFHPEMCLHLLFFSRAYVWTINYKSNKKYTIVTIEHDYVELYQMTLFPTSQIVGCCEVRRLSSMYDWYVRHRIDLSYMPNYTSWSMIARVMNGSDEWGKKIGVCYVLWSLYCGATWYCDICMEKMATYMYTWTAMM